jgi:hypothetical protein
MTKKGEGFDVDAAIKCLQYVFTKKFLVDYNLRGTSGKKSFEQLAPIPDVLLGKFFRNESCTLIFFNIAIHDLIQKARQIKPFRF